MRSPIAGGDSGAIVPAGTTKTSSLIEVDEAGNTIASTPLEPWLFNPMLVMRGQGRLHGVDGWTGLLTEVVTSGYIESSYAFTPGAAAPSESRCKTPVPLGTHKGLLPREALYKYRLFDDFSEEQSRGVNRAFEEWNNVNAASGLGTRFAPATEGDTTDIQVRKYDLGVNSRGQPIIGAFPNPTENSSYWAPDHQHIIGGVLLLTTDISRLFSEKGYFKATMHEIGHALGLAHHDPTGTNGSSVMNSFALPVGGNLLEKRDDRRGNIPDRVTECDRQAAKDVQTP